MNQSIHLLDLIEKEKLDEIIRVFTGVTGVASTIANLEGEPITELHNFTPLCLEYCRSTEKGRRKCYESDGYGGLEAARSGSPFIYKCLNIGIIDSAVPIIVAGRHVASMFCGQVLEEPIDLDEAVERAISIGITDLDGFVKEIKKIPFMSRERLRDIVNLMRVIIETVSELALKKYLLHKQSKHYLFRLINSVSDCIFSTNPDSTISIINEAGSKMFGYEEADIIGQLMTMFFSDDHSIMDCKKELESGRNQNIRTEVKAIKNDGQYFPVQMSLSKINDQSGKPQGFVGVIRDISEEKKIERMKEDLIGMVTHDMRNPVLSLQKAIQLMVDGNLGPTTPTQMEVMHMALATSHQLFGLTNDLLDIYRNESGQFSLQYSLVDVPRIILEIINQLKFLAKDKNISIVFDPPPHPLNLNGDQNRLMRTCLNILDNAIRYSPEGGNITIASYRVNEGNGKAVLDTIPRPFADRVRNGEPHILTSVSDQGPGIPIQYHHSVFDKFFTIKSKDKKGRKGTGLGLAFCKQTIEAHRGGIWVDSTALAETSGQNKGCRFCFILPEDFERNNAL